MSNLFSQHVATTVKAKLMLSHNMDNIWLKFLKLVRMLKRFLWCLKNNGFIVLVQIELDFVNMGKKMASLPEITYDFDLEVERF